MCAWCSCSVHPFAPSLADTRLTLPFPSPQHRGPSVENRMPSHRRRVPHLVLLDQLPERLGRVPVVPGAKQVRHHRHGIVSRQRQGGSTLAVSCLQGKITRACVHVHVCVCMCMFVCACACACVCVCVCEGFSRTAQHVMTLPSPPPAADKLRCFQWLCRDEHISVLP